MAKSVYSLVLANEVVAAVDALASQRGLSRSALVQHILADYVSIDTPEAAAQQILAHLHDAGDKIGFRPSFSSPQCLTLRTSLSYKYNPALSYTVQLAGGNSRLRVALRSQSQPVLSYFDIFFNLWNRLEEKYLDPPPAAAAHSLREKQYLRTLRLQPLSGEDAGKAISAYIETVDTCMKAFFDNVEDAAAAVAATENQYLAMQRAFHGLPQL